MEKKKLDIMIKCIAAIAAFVLFGILVFWSKGYDKGTDTQYSVVCLGDSNFGNIQNETGIIFLLEEHLGVRVLNGAFGGSMMTTTNGKKTEYYGALSMHNIAISICNKNFGVQKAAMDTIERTDYIGFFTTTLDKLSRVDFESTDILIIEHGVNDYLAGVTIKNGTDPYDTSTFTGALRSSIDMLRQNYPELRIVLVTPAYCVPMGEGGTLRPCDVYDYGGGYLEAYVNAELEVAGEMDVEIIDLYHGMDINVDNFPTYLYDGLHYTEYARGLVAERIANHLLGEVE